jgi:hypothetical protein
MRVNRSIAAQLSVQGLSQQAALARNAMDAL